ncbi:MAG: hypothetical protein ABI212_05615 [Burkholderiaceae bacterium]
MADRFVKHQVRASLNEPDGAHCIDVFMRVDRTCGFELLRRDVDDGGAWQCLHRFGSRSFDSGQKALDVALAGVPWLEDTGLWRW